MNWTVVAKIAISVVATGLVAFSQAVTTNPSAGGKIIFAAVASAVGSYLLGLYQSSPMR